MRKSLAALLASTLLLAACGGGDGGPDPSEDPDGALVEAFKDLAEGDGPSMTVSIASNEESLNTLFEESDDVPEGMAETILDSSFSFGFSNVENPEDAKGEIIFDLAGEEAAAITIDGYDVYAHVDVPYIMETFGEDPAQAEQQLQNVPEGFEFIEQVYANEWIHLTGLEELAQQAESGGGDNPTDISAQQKRLVEEMSTALEENSEITEGDEEGPGTHLEAKVDMRGLVESFKDVTADLVPFPTDDTSTSNVPEGDLILDTWVDGGTLKQIELDFVKNKELFESGDDPLPEGVDEFGIVIEVEEFDGDVEVPDDATEVSFEQIMQGIFGAVAGSAPSGEAPEMDPCADIENLPTEQQEAFKDICP